MSAPLTRRTFGASLAGALGLAAGARAQSRPPNILFLMGDNVRGDTLGYMGHPVVKTPTLDALARTGVALTHCYSAAGGGNPSRVSALSGRYPRTHGVTTADSPLTDTSVLLPAILSKHGYRTGLVGDFELPGRDMAELFDSSATFSGDYKAFFEEKFPDRNGDIYALARKVQAQGPVRWRVGGSILSAEDHPVGWMANRTIDFVQAAKEGEPWFCFVSFHDPANSYISPFPWPTRYPPQQISIPRLPEERPKPPTAEDQPSDYVTKGDEAALIDVRRAYFGGVSYLDEQIGRIVRKLRSLGQLENTLIVFTSAHGDMLGDQGRMGPEAPYDGAIHTPCTLHYEAGFKISGGVHRVTDTTCLAPTLLDLAGLPLPEGFQTPSAKQIVTVVGAEWDDAALLDNRFHALRTAEWKLVEPRDHPTWTPELYHLTDDPAETNNLYGKPEASKAQADLAKRLQAWEEA
ncbi:MAG: sulfatase-like hydrolase/transferase [Bryobacterales bacterium]